MIGSELELVFTLTSNSIQLGGSNSRVIISFPLSYLPRLSREDIITC